MKKTAFTYASRQEIDVELQCFEGTIPDDLSGYVFMNSPVGTVNNETPMPKHNADGSRNDEYGQPIFSGDGMVFKFDCETPNKIRAKSALVKTPCFYADLNTKRGTDYYNKGFRFNSNGFARSSMLLGARNQVNTSLNAFRFNDNQSPRLTVNFDAGRPFEIDPHTLEVVTAVGYNREWRAEFPKIIHETFDLIQCTAHPSFDAETHEYFSVCFQRSVENLIFTSRHAKQLSKFKDFVVDGFKKFALLILEAVHFPEGKVLSILQDFLGHITKQTRDKNLPDYSKEQLEALLFKKTAKKQLIGVENAVRLVKWTGKTHLEGWNLIDEEGNNIVINQTMHQTAFSKDYIILVDTSLKFSLDMIENAIIPGVDWLNRLIRWLLFKVLEPTTPLYLVKRADLIPGNKNVIVKKLRIGIETIHFAVEYDNPDDVITLFAAHNSASCAAEWIRPYDTLATNDERVFENTLGLLTCGEMDISRVGKFKIDGKKGEFISQKLFYDKGFDGNDVNNLIRPHTWAVGLLTHRHIFSARNNTPTIPYIFWQNYGLDYRMLTTFIKDMYTSYQNRAIEVGDLLNYYKNGVPFCISRMNTENLAFEDWYYFKMNENLRSLQYMRKRGNKVYKSIEEEALDGYIMCSMVNGNEDLTGNDYSREIWIFDAANLKQGPVCKLQHPDMQFGFTIHSVWLNEAKPSPRDYHVNTIVDYLEVIENFNDKEKQEEMFEFLAKTVFPYYPNDVQK